MINIKNIDHSRIGGQSSAVSRIRRVMLETLGVVCQILGPPALSALGRCGTISSSPSSSASIWPNMDRGRDDYWKATTVTTKKAPSSLQEVTEDLVGRFDGMADGRWQML